MQQAGGNVPLVTVVGNDVDSFLVEAQYRAFDFAAIRSLKTDPVALSKANFSSGSFKNFE